MAEAVQHSPAAKAFHWGFILVYGYGLAKQVDEVEELADLALLRAELIFASFFLLLLLVRFVFMQRTRPSAMSDSTPPRQRQLARLVHLSLYASLSLTALSGLAIGGLYWAARSETPAMTAMLMIHEVAVIATYWLIGGHIAAAVYHRFPARWNLERHGAGLERTPLKQLRRPLLRFAGTPVARVSCLQGQETGVSAMDVKKYMQPVVPIQDLLVPHDDDAGWITTDPQGMAAVKPLWNQPCIRRLGRDLPLAGRLQRAAPQTSRGHSYLCGLRPSAAARQRLANRRLHLPKPTASSTTKRWRSRIRCT